jgi:Cu/Ag efflux pump CusA
LLIILGVHMAGDTALDVFPEFAPPLIEIQTEAPGLSTEEVESLVTVPIENALQGAPWVMYGRRPRCKRNPREIAEHDAGRGRSQSVDRSA